MGKYGPKPIHEIGAYRRLGRNTLIVLVLDGCGLAFASRGGSVELSAWLIALGVLALGAAVGLWHAMRIVRRADEVYRPGAAASFAPLLSLVLAGFGLAILRSKVDDSHQLFVVLVGLAACLAYLATMGLVVAVRLRAITSGEREWPWPSRLD